jgi:splicing factor 3A subunit 3
MGRDQIRDRLELETQISQLLDQIQSQSTKLLDVYRDENGTRAKEILDLGGGEAEFYNQLQQLRDHHVG